MFELIGASMKRHDEIRKDIDRLKIEAAGARKTSRAYRSRETAIRMQEKKATSIARASRKLTEMYVAAKAREAREKQTTQSRTR